MSSRRMSYAFLSNLSSASKASPADSRISISFLALTTSASALRDSGSSSTISTRILAPHMSRFSARNRHSAPSHTVANLDLESAFHATRRNSYPATGTTARHTVQNRILDERLHDQLRYR